MSVGLALHMRELLLHLLQVVAGMHMYIVY